MSRPPTRREAARRFLLDALGDGPTPSREVRAAALADKWAVTPSLAGI